MIKFTIPGQPVPKARPRVTRKGTYTPETTKHYEKVVQASFMATKTRKMMDGPLKADLVFYLSKPKRPKHPRHPITKPDIDNYQKAVMDALNGMAYCDDSQIVVVYAEKRYSESPRVVVTLTEVE